MFPESKCLHQFGETIISLTDSKKRKYSAVFLDSSDCRSILMADIPDKSEKNNKARVWATRTVPLLKPAITDLLANVKPSCKNIWSPLKVEMANLWRVAKLAFVSTFLITADIQLFSCRSAQCVCLSGAGELAHSCFELFPLKQLPATPCLITDESGESKGK